MESNWEVIKELKADMITSFHEVGPIALRCRDVCMCLYVALSEGLSLVSAPLIHFCCLFRFASAAYSYQKDGAPLAISGYNFFHERPDKECAGLNVPAGKCNNGMILGRCTDTLRIAMEAESAV
jgi:hypothetical protein